MANPLIWKIYDADGNYMAATRYGEDAANIVGNMDGGKVKHASYGVVWNEGREEFSAAESWDGCREVMWERVKAKHAKRMAKLGISQ